MNQEYAGPYPFAEFYGADFMSVEDRGSFLEWHEGKKNSVFDFNCEMSKYCRSNLTILRQTCLKFRSILLNEVSIDPFQFATLPSNLKLPKQVKVQMKYICSGNEKERIYIE